MPFTPSAEYRSAPRNVVLAFARVPFYPFARRLIHVSIPRPPILPPIFYPLSFPSYSPPLPRYFSPFLRPIVAARVCLSFFRIPRPLATSIRPSGVRYLSHPPRVSSSAGLPRWSATKHGLIKNENGAGDASGNGISDGDPINAPAGRGGNIAKRVTTFVAIRACRGAREINLTIRTETVSTEELKAIIISESQRSA